MAVRVDWGIVQSNQCNITGQIFDDSGNPLTLTNYTLRLVIKPTETSLDSAGTTYTPTITSAVLGKWSLTIDGTNFATAGTSWYRLDVIDGNGKYITANLGSSTVMAA